MGLITVQLLPQSSSPRIMMPRLNVPRTTISDVFVEVEGLGLDGGVSCVGWFGGRRGGSGREDEPAANVLSYSALLSGSLRTSHASFSRLVVASALGLGFWSG